MVASLGMPSIFTFVGAFIVVFSNLKPFLNNLCDEMRSGKLQQHLGGSRGALLDRPTTSCQTQLADELLLSRLVATVRQYEYEPHA